MIDTVTLNAFKSGLDAFLTLTFNISVLLNCGLLIFHSYWTDGDQHRLAFSRTYDPPSRTILIQAGLWNQVRVHLVSTWYVQ